MIEKKRGKCEKSNEKKNINRNGPYRTINSKRYLTERKPPTHFTRHTHTHSSITYTKPFTIILNVLQLKGSFIELKFIILFVVDVFLCVVCACVKFRSICISHSYFRFEMWRNTICWGTIAVSLPLTLIRSHGSEWCRKPGMLYYKHRFTLYERASNLLVPI